MIWIPLAARGSELSSLAIQVFLSGNFDDKRDITFTIKNYTLGRSTRKTLRVSLSSCVEENDTRSELSLLGRIL